jgi:ribonuclease D
MTQTRRSLPLPIFVQTNEDLAEMLARLMAEPVIAVDSESNSLYAYAERVCLLQFSVPGQDYMIDPLLLEDLSPLGEVFADAGIEKVFHAAEYDVMVLRRDYGFEFVNLFDTMIASRIVGWSRYGLGSLLEEHFGVRTDKRMQRTNWGERPLSIEQLEYAQRDTHFLLALRDKLLAELEAQGRVEEARAAFARVTQSEWTAKAFDPDGFWRIKGAKDLDDVGLAVLRELYLYRDRRAQELDRPPFKVLDDRVLVALSEQRPQSVAELGRIHGVPRRASSRARKRILALIKRGMRAEAPERPERERNARWDEEYVRRYEALRHWRKGHAQKRGVEPDVVLSNRVLRSLARHNPTSPEQLAALDVLNDWEQRTYGRALVSLLRRQQRIGS